MNQGSMIRVQDLRFSYPGSPEQTLKGLDFEVVDGEIFGFLGPSGAGKSTTQNVLVGLLGGYAGAVELMGRSPAAWGSDLFEDVGVAFEAPSHFERLTATENLRYFGGLYQGQVESPERLLELVNLESAADQLVSHFSKGMKRRLTFVRSLMHHPRLLFLDEPTSGLDPANARRIKDLILERREAGTTIFLTTHDMAAAEELCDWVAFLVDGELRALDAPERLKDQYGERKVVVELDLATGVEEKEYELDDLGQNETFLNDIRTHRVRRIHSQESTLEDVFLKVTGRSLG